MFGGLLGKVPRLRVAPRPLITWRVEKMGGVLVEEIENRDKVCALRGGSH